MMPPVTRPWARRGRIATLVAAPWIAMLAGALGARDPLFAVAVPILAALWLAMVATVITRAMQHEPTTARAPLWEGVDVLTATGAATLWTATIALVLAGVIGWASLAVLGVIGLGAVELAATWTALVAGGNRPWRDALIRRAITPEVAVEGDPLCEEITLAGVRIPTGTRLFVVGWTTWHGRVTRYAIGAESGGAELKLTAQLGPAQRGVHRAPLLRLWLADTLGLTRTQVTYRGSADFVVLPRPAIVDGARGLVAAGGDDQATRPSRQPTEGTLRIRDYLPGDDTRRIHWVRSLQVDKLIMRLPDEVPPAEPAVRLVLDNELNPAYAYLCRAPNELLDALVDVWLGVANALTAAGTRVTLVAAAAPIAHDEQVEPIERVVHAGAPREALRLGARIGWQNQIALTRLLARGAARQLVVSARIRSLAAHDGVVEPRWIVVPEPAWTTPETWLPNLMPNVLAFPLGAADNRRGRRRREDRRMELVQRDRAMFSQAMNCTGWQPTPGHFIARPGSGRVQLAVMP